MKMEDFNTHRTLHKFARFMLDKHVFMVNWKTDEQFDWADSIEEFIAEIEKEDEEELSACCAAPFYEETDICTECNEHG